MVGLFDGAEFNATSLVLAVASAWFAIYFGRMTLRPAYRELRITAVVLKTVNQSACVVILNMQATGLHDIPSSQFDGGRACSITLNAPIERFNSDATVFRLDKDGRISFGPELLVRGRSYQATAVCSHDPKLAVHEHFLIDTDVRVKQVEDREDTVLHRVVDRGFTVADRIAEKYGEWSFDSTDFWAFLGLLSSVAGLVLSWFVYFGG